MRAHRKFRREPRGLLSSRGNGNDVLIILISPNGSIGQSNKNEIIVASAEAIAAPILIVILPAEDISGYVR